MSSQQCTPGAQRSVQLNTPPLLQGPALTDKFWILMFTWHLGEDNRTLHCCGAGWLGRHAPLGHCMQAPPPGPIDRCAILPQDLLLASYIVMLLLDCSGGLFGQVHPPGSVVCESSGEWPDAFSSFLSLRPSLRVCRPVAVPGPWRHRRSCTPPGVRKRVETLGSDSAAAAAAHPRRPPARPPLRLTPTPALPPLLSCSYFN